MAKGTEKTANTAVPGDIWMRYLACRVRLEEFGQTHLLRFFGELTNAEREELLNDIENTDLEKMKRLYKAAKAQAEGQTGECGTEAKRSKLNIIPPEVEDEKELDPEEIETRYKAGLEAIGAGKLAAVTMAGGQGTRLGHNGPKGTFDIGLDSHRSLFELHANRLKAVGKAAGNIVPWYIMTSEINHVDTVEFFKAHGNFGYPAEKLSFFPQTMIPAMTPDGKLQLVAKNRILKSPNGNGGLFMSMRLRGITDELKARGIEYIAVTGVDNCLVKMADPLFLGTLLRSSKKGAVAAAKSYLKRGPDEKAGVFCLRNGRPCVIEYTEVPQKYAEMTDPEGKYVYGDCNLLSYIFETDTVEKLGGDGMQYHTAVKKITFIDTGSGEETERSGCYKFELFLFDAFPELDGLEVLRVDRRDEFAPVKNLHGEDSADTAREMYIDYFRRNGENGNV